MAMTTGCDTAECFFLKRIGIDQSEFTDATGTGRVRVYLSPTDALGVLPGVWTSNAMTLWNTPNAAEMLKYDIIFDACECSTPSRGVNGYTNILKYLNAGGRVFTTHFFYNFFADKAQCTEVPEGNPTCQGQPPLPSVGAWRANQNLAFASTGVPAADCPNGGTDAGPYLGGDASCLSIDTAVPKGVAFAQWYQNNSSKIGPAQGGEKYGYVGATDIRQDMGMLQGALVEAGTATPWLYATGGNTFPESYDAYYFSFNTPVGTDPTTQCGRAIFSDVHLDFAGGGGYFPNYCAPDPNTNTHASNQLALEFLFFDLASCVQNDTQPPLPTPY
jgi:hypothetical protein